MRLARFNDGKYGIVVGDVIHDITAVVERIVARAGAVRGDPVIAALDQIKASVPDPETDQEYPIADVALLSPVGNRSKLVAAPTNYRWPE
jgi:hypothetical protein